MEGHAGPRGEWRGASFGAAAVAMETEAADESGFTSVASKRGRRKRRAAGAEPMEAAESAEAAGPQPSKRPAFPPLPAAALGVSAGPGGSGWDGPGGGSARVRCSPPLCPQVGKGEVRKVPVPANRYTPLKENWMKIFTPIVEHLQLQIRFNLKTRNVEIKVSAAPCIMFCFLLSLKFY